MANIGEEFLQARKIPTNRLNVRKPLLCKRRIVQAPSAIQIALIREMELELVQSRAPPRQRAVDDVNAEPRVYSDGYRIDPGKDLSLQFPHTSSFK